jgi:hypothetical protein
MNDRVVHIVELTNQAEGGLLDKLQCPKCRHLAVFVWFTRPAEDEYRTWFLCTACSFHTRAHNTGKPHFFSEERRRLDLEARDTAILKKAVFRRPPQ